jgi:hypothetical protein
MVVTRITFLRTIEQPPAVDTGKYFGREIIFVDERVRTRKNIIVAW